MTALAARPLIPDAVLWEFPVFDSYALGQGIRGQHLPLSASRMLHVTAYFPAPLGAEPREQEGVTHLCAALLTEGTRTRDGARFAAESDRVAATIWADVSIDGVVVGLDVPLDHARTGLELWADALTSPVFDERELERHRRELVAGIRSRQSNGPVVAGMTMDKTLYGDGDRRSRPASGDEQTVANVDREAVVRRYGQVFRPDIAQVLSVGDLPTDELAGLIGDALSGWDPAPVETEVPEPSTSAGPARTVLVDRPGAGQTALEIGCRTTDAADPRQSSLRIASRILGEGIRSRLNLVLREQKGYTYGVRTQVLTGRTGGVFHVSGTVATGVTGAALADALEILEAFRTEGPTASEHAEAVAAIASRTPIGHQTGRDILQTALRGVRAGLPTDWTTAMLAEVAASTPDSVADDYRRLVPEQLTVVVAGDENACAPLLAAAQIAVDAD